MFRQTIIRNARLFSTNARLQKSATETVKDTLKAVDRTVSDAAVKGISKGGMLSSLNVSFSDDAYLHLRSLVLHLTASVITLNAGNKG